MPILFKDIEVADNGAQFFNADLHIHSYGASHDVRDATMTVTAIIDEAIQLGISLVAITDHNSDVNTKASIDHAKKYTGKILVLPGVEITTANGHLLAYFSPDNYANVRNLLAKINIVGDHGNQNSRTTMSMTDVIKQAELLGGVCIAAHIDREKTGFEKLSEGYPNWKKDIVLSPGLYGLEHDDDATLSWYSDGDDSSTQGAERRKIAAAREKLAATIGRPLLAHIQGSDSHTLNDFKAGRAGKLLTRFKMDELSFDGFRTALADPEARVRATATIPVSLPRILGMHVTGGFLDGECIRFSDNLTCIIGGRGTGKSSALKALAYGLGVDDSIEDLDTCPGTIIVYGEDAGGVRYRFERVQGAKPNVKAKEDGEIIDVPRDAFRVEYYKQGELAEVAKDPLKNPVLLQKFLDRHLLLDDLLGKEEQLIRALEQNSAQLIPQETNANQLSGKKATLQEINKKLQIAEEGNLKDVVSDQKKLTNEKAMAGSLDQIRQDYVQGLDLTVLLRNFDECQEEASPLTELPGSQAALAKIKASVERTNEFLKQQEKIINARLTDEATKIAQALVELKTSQKQLETRVNTKITALQKKGLTGNLAELATLLKKKSALTQEVTKINGQAAQLRQLRADRQRYIKQLEATRQEIAERRKAQLSSINTNLAATIKDYTVFLHYDPKGVIEDFKNYILDKMHGTYFQEETAEQFCTAITPPELAKLVLDQDFDALAARGGISKQWATDLCGKLRYFQSLHELEVMWKAPCPLITAKTKNDKPKEIPVNQLSDGQKHTIMLTIAMLAESNIPLIIDQPEDDLDNAFIFSAVVKVLRTIKERRQVILVTHNANIAVLGDAELLLPMHRKGEGGGAFDRGSIDKTETKQVVLSILEGGKVAFERRKEIYGH